MVVELCSTVDMRMATYRLLAGSDPYALPVSGMVSNVVDGRLASCHVFADRWPNFRSLVCLRSCDEYSRRKMDFATWYSPDAAGFADMFRKLAVKRHWLSGAEGRDLILHYVNSDYRQVLVDDLNINPNTVDDHSYNLFSCDRLLSDAEAMEALEQQVKVVRDSLPDGLVVSQLQAKDAETVACRQERKMPDKVEYYRWLIERLPSACVRTRDGQPVAWRVTYDSGATGSLFVLPSYRRHRLALLVVAHDVKQRLNRLHAFAAVAEGNRPSELLLEKHFGGKALNVKVSWIVCYHEDASESGRP